MKALLVAGTFDNDWGRESTVGEDLIEGIERELNRAFNSLDEIKMEIESWNGGSISQLEDFALRAKEYTVICWFANVVDNALPKIVQDIKKNNPRCFLVTSKRIVEKDYTPADIVAHALNIKSNLVIPIYKHSVGVCDPGRYVGLVVDPLGNLFKFDRNAVNEDFIDVGVIAGRRIVHLLRNTTRVGSIQRDGNVELGVDIEEFCNSVGHCADAFTRLLPKPSKVESTRFIGNASFRCSHGFPSYYDGELIWVSRRNIDKRDISPSGFVAVKPGRLPVEYYGDKKPSVDTPIHIMLYNYYDAKYILHGHVYVKDAPMTDYPVPCGSLEEFNAILRKLPSPSIGGSLVTLNLAGHGFIAMSNKPKHFLELEDRFIERPLWEEWEV